MADPIKDTSALEMSDEDFLKEQPSLFETPAPVDDTDHNEGEAEDAQESDPAPVVEEPPAKEPAEEKPAGEVTPETVTDPTPEPTKEADVKPASALSDAQYAEIGRQIMAEFKANGSTMQVKSVDDALQLMQMGANYHKKMTGLKPSLKTLKLLQNNDLLDPEKLNYLIDLSQKKPEAIKQLLKDSKIDPLTLDMEEELNYVPAKRTVSDREMMLEEVLNNISNSPSYERTLGILSDEWDDASRKSIADDPQIIGVINAHMENGIFDQVVNAVAYERSLGKFVGVSELEAYQRVGAYMHENNLFKGATVKPPQQVTPVVQDPQPQNPPSTPQDDDRKNRKKAASPSRQGPVVSKKDANYNPLDMSDEEFVKLNNLRL